MIARSQITEPARIPQPRTRLLLHSFLFSIALTSAGCSSGYPRVVRTYAGPPRPRGEIAVLWYWTTSNVSLSAVDGRSDLYFQPVCTRKEACILELPPGKHSVTVGFTEGVQMNTDRLVPMIEISRSGLFISAHDKVVEFDAAAGAFYTISATKTVTGFESSEKGQGKELKPVYLGDEEWTVRVEPAGDPDHPVEE